VSEFLVGFGSDCVQTPTSEDGGNLLELLFAQIRLRWRGKDGRQSLLISFIVEAGRMGFFWYFGPAWFRSAASATIRKSNWHESAAQMVIMSDIISGGRIR
jgi:hypothetical protein